MKTWRLGNFCEFDKYAVKSYCAIHGTDETLNLGDITKVDETKLEPFTMIVGGSPCFTAGTDVSTMSGYKHIEDVRVGDMVLTHNNRYMKVDRIGGEQDKEIYKLKCQGILDIYATDYHPFYIKKKAGDSPEKIKLKDIEKGYYVGSHINNKSINELNLTNELCWVLGRYVADGHIRHERRNDRKDSYQYGLILSIGEGKLSYVKERITTYNYSCYPHSQSVSRLVINSKDLVEFVERFNFGKSAIDKNIPQFILDLPVDKLKSFLDGYMSGDGCEIKNTGLYSATTISRRLAMSLCVAIQKVYNVGCRIYFTERPKTYEIQGRTVNQHDTYIVRFSTTLSKQSWFIEDGIVWYPVKNVEKTDRVENVYNIEVHEDHTYVVNNAITYNCQDFSVAGKQKGSRWTCKNEDCKHEYNPLTVHYSKRGECPVCGSTELDKSRSSLLVEWLRIIRGNKPNFGIYENVKNIVGKEFKETTFKLFEEELNEYGYNTYWKVMNGKNYGIPQNRERVFLILIKKELDNGLFKFPDEFPLELRLKDMLEDKVDEKYYLPSEVVSKITERFLENNKGVKECKAEEIDVVETLRGVGKPWDSRHESTCRIYNPKGTAPTVTAGGGGGVEPKIICEQRCDEGIRFFKDDVCGTIRTIDCGGDKRVIHTGDNYRIRKLTPTECFRLMGFLDEDINKCIAAGLSNTQLYKQAGNSIITDCLYHLLKELYIAMPYLFDDLVLSSYFSGIGAFEKALDRLFDDINKELIK